MGLNADLLGVGDVKIRHGPHPIPWGKGNKRGGSQSKALGSKQSTLRLTTNVTKHKGGRLLAYKCRVAYTTAIYKRHFAHLLWAKFTIGRRDSSIEIRFIRLKPNEAKV